MSSDWGLVARAILQQNHPRCFYPASRFSGFSQSCRWPLTSDAEATTLRRLPEQSGATKDDGGAASTPDGGPGTTDVGITVSGKVVWDSVNVKGVTVVIAGQTATTGDNGSFTISNVHVPYTAHVVVPKELAIPNGPPATAAGVSSFVGLTTGSPVLTVAAKSNSAVGAVQGAVAGGSTDAKSTYSVMAGAPLVGFALQTGDVGGGGSNTTPKSYKVSQAWNVGQTQQIVSVVAIEFRYPEGLQAFTGIPTTYTSIASSVVALTAGGTSAGNLGTFAPVTTKKISGTITAPAGYSVTQHQLSLLGSGGGSFDFSQSLQTTTFEYPVPDDSTTFSKVRIGAVAYAGVPGQVSDASVDVVPGTSNIGLTFPGGPTIAKPADGAAGVKPGDTLSWTDAGDRCLYEATLTTNADTGTHFTIRTAGTSVTVPDLASYGASLAASTTYSFGVHCIVLDATTKASLDDDAVLGRAPSHASSGAPLRNFVTQ